MKSIQAPSNQGRVWWDYVVTFTKLIWSLHRWAWITCSNPAWIHHKHVKNRTKMTYTSETSRRCHCWGSNWPTLWWHLTFTAAKRWLLFDEQETLPSKDMKKSNEGSKRNKGREKGPVKAKVLAVRSTSKLAEKRAVVAPQPVSLGWARLLSSCTTFIPANWAAWSLGMLCGPDVWNNYRKLQ